MTDDYLPGAMVLAHSLRDHGTKKQLAVLVTLDSLQASTIDELQVCIIHGLEFRYRAYSFGSESMIT